MNRRESDAKPSNPDNPKDRVAGTKLPSGLCPDTAIVHLSLAFLEGALKYGRYNWRIAGVSASVYNDALERHRKKWWNGQNRDPETRVHHLANLMACCAIMLDAELYGKLNDDRPPCPDPDAMARLIDEQSELVVHLKKMFESHSPRQFKLGDTAESVAAEAVPAGTVVAERCMTEVGGWYCSLSPGHGGAHVAREYHDGKILATSAEDPPLMPYDAPEVSVAHPVYCDTIGCFNPPGHSGPHSDYEGVNFAPCVFVPCVVDVSGEESGEDQDDVG